MGLVSLHARYVFSYLNDGYIFEEGEDVAVLGFTALTTVYALQFNYTIMCNIIPRLRRLLDFCQLIIIILGILKRFFGF